MSLQQQILKEEPIQGSKQKFSTPSFLIKTYDILENPAYKSIISWTQDGQAFVVKNINELAVKILPNHFKHNNYASFVRQLNMYDFHKIKNESGENEFRHKYFQKGNKLLLSEIKRKQGDQNEQMDERQNQSGEESENSIDLDVNKLKNDYQFFLNEMLGIKNKQHELQKAIGLIITQNDHLINENKLLWQEIKRIRETDERKIETLSFLLATVITNIRQLPQNMMPNMNNLSILSQLNQRVNQQQSQQPNFNFPQVNFRGNLNLSLFTKEPEIQQQLIQNENKINNVQEEILRHEEEREKQNLSEIEGNLLKKNCTQQPSLAQFPIQNNQFSQHQNQFQQNLLQQYMNLQQMHQMTLQQQQSQMFQGQNQLNQLPTALIQQDPIQSLGNGLPNFGHIENQFDQNHNNNQLLKQLEMLGCKIQVLNHQQELQQQQQHQQQQSTLLQSLLGHQQQNLLPQNNQLQMLNLQLNNLSRQQGAQALEKQLLEQAENFMKKE